MIPPGAAGRRRVDQYRRSPDRARSRRSPAPIPPTLTLDDTAVDPRHATERAHDGLLGLDAVAGGEDLHGDAARRDRRGRRRAGGPAHPGRCRRRRRARQEREVREREALERIQVVKELAERIDRIAHPRHELDDPIDRDLDDADHHGQLRRDELEDRREQREDGRHELAERLEQRDHLTGSNSLITGRKTDPIVSPTSLNASAPRSCKPCALSAYLSA